MSRLVHRYTCICGHHEMLSNWDLDRASRPRCGACGSISLTRDDTPPQAPPRRRRKPKPRLPKTPAEREAARIRWLKARHEDLKLRLRHGWKPNPTS